MSEEDKPKAPTDPLLSAVDSVRATSKWLIAAFAAVGAALIAGSQLSDLGDLSDDGGRLFLACLGAVIGLAGVAVAVYSTAKVLLPTRVLLGAVIKDESNSALGKAVADDQSLLDGHATSIAGLYDAYKTSLQQYETAWNAYSSEEDPNKKTELAADVDEAESERDTLAETLNQIRKLGLFLAVKETFEESAPYIIGAAATAALGIVVFAYAAHPPDDPKDRVPQLENPTPVVATLSELKAEGLKDALGKCDLAKVHALALSGSAKDGYDIVTLPQTTGCNAVRLTVAGDKVAPDTSIAVTKPTPSPAAPMPATATAPKPKQSPTATPK